MDFKGKKIFVGLSGGVDSAVTAALLQQHGAQVTGVFIKGWYPPDMPCTWAEDRRDAMRVAARLGIPFHTLEAGTEYKTGVIDYMLAEYAAGRTPNPDVMCNREVKFGAFFRFAKAQGADLIATGHYARATHDSLGSRLLRGTDNEKDQSYFLWAIPKEALARTIFPLGEFHKQEVRELALQFNLPVAAKKDSQGVCFLGSISVDDFLRKELAPEPGIAIDELGKEVGTHDGAVLYTLGERIALRDAMPGPWFVIRKEMKENVLTVSPASRQIVANEDHNPAIQLRDMNWLGERPASNARIEAQYRYHGVRIPGSLTARGNVFVPDEPLAEEIAAGQSLVLYQQEVCLGGGIIA